MKYILYFFLAFFMFLFLFAKYSKKFANPYKLIMIFGKKGSGKTTLLCKLALRDLKRGYKVYSTVRIPGCVLIDADKIGRYTFPPESSVYCDEVGIIWDNRNFKNFRTDVRDYFKFQRQYRNKVTLFSQTFDVDLKLRNLTDAMYLCECRGNVFSFARRIKRSITIVNPVGDAESRIADSLEFVAPIWQLFGVEAFILTWIPHWVRYFKSFDPPKIPFMPGDPLPFIHVPTKFEIFRVSFWHKFFEDVRYFDVKFFYGAKRLLCLRSAAEKAKLFLGHCLILVNKALFWLYSRINYLF